MFHEASVVLNDAELLLQSPLTQRGVSGDSPLFTQKKNQRSSAINAQAGGCLREHDASPRQSTEDNKKSALSGYKSLRGNIPGCRHWDANRTGGHKCLRCFQSFISYDCLGSFELTNIYSCQKSPVALCKEGAHGRRRQMFCLFHIRYNEFVFIHSFDCTSAQNVNIILSLHGWWKMQPLQNPLQTLSNKFSFLRSTRLFIGPC